MEKIKEFFKKAGIVPLTAFIVSALAFVSMRGFSDITTGLVVAAIVSALLSVITVIIKNKKENISSTDNNQADAEESRLTGKEAEIYAIQKESSVAMNEMAKIYSSVQDKEIKAKINEIMRITDKITQDAAADPGDLPQIKKFFNYYLPSTIKLLNTYDRMGNQNVSGENIEKTMSSINEMLDTVIVAYRKQLDALFEDQAMDAEADIKVMNTMLTRDGLSGTSDFK